MATGGSMDSRVMCSVCLEPYRGRQPKLLRCYHTFCLPCLAQLARENPQGSAADNNQIEEGAQKTERPFLIITCPNCRTETPVPPGGVKDLQSNFYVDGDDDSASSCPEPISSGTISMAKPADSTKSIDLEAMVDSQINVMERALARLGEEERDITQQRRTLDHSIQIRYAAALKHLADTRDQSLISLKDAAQAAQDKLDVEKSLAETKLHLLTQLKNQADPSWKTQPPGTYQTMLLSESTVRHFQQVSQQKGTKTYFIHTPCDSVTPALIDSCSQFMGIVVPCGMAVRIMPRGTRVPVKPAVGTIAQTNMSSLQNEVDKIRQDHSSTISSHQSLQHDVRTLAADMEKLQMHLTSLEKENARVLKELRGSQGTVTSLQAALTDNSGLQQEVNSLHHVVQQLQQSVAAVEAENARLHQAVDVDRINSTKEVAALKDAASTSRENTATLQSKLDLLESSFEKYNTPVAFHASVNASFHLKAGNRIKFHFVTTNVGGGYNPNSGVFVAPVRGIYVFMVTLNPWDNSKRMPDISVAGNVLLFSRVAKENAPLTLSTGHIAVELKKGHQVWVQSVEDCYINNDTGVAYFSGALLQAIP